MSNEILIAVPKPQEYNSVPDSRAVGRYIPLYERFPSQLGNPQLLDEPTLESFEKLHRPNKMVITDVLPSYKPLAWKDIQAPKKEAFQDPNHYNSIHGWVHMVIVELYAEASAQDLGLDDRKRRLVRKAAEIHDVRRIRDDNRDNQHGERAQQWLLHSEEAQSIRDEFPQEDIAIIGELCKYHELGLKRIREETDPANLDMHRALIRADAYERWRALEWWKPNPDRIEMEDREKLSNFLSFTEYFSLYARLDAYRKNVSIEESIKQLAIETRLVLPDNSENKDVYYLTEGVEALVA